MFSPLNDPHVADWFRRLDAAWRRMPAEEQARQREEVQQHLEALAAANEELGSSPEEARQFALSQFGDPSKFGKRMAWEWQRKQGFIGPQIASVFYGIVICSASMFAVAAIDWLVTASLHFVMNITLTYDPFPSVTCGALGIPIVTGVAVGWKYPRHALKGASYAACLWPLLPAFALFLRMLQPCLVSPMHIYWPNFAIACFAFPVWLFLTCGASYFASVTKRGWYKPSWEDFKITLPSRTKQMSC